MKKVVTLTAILLFSFLSAASPYQNGDLIFQESQSAQSTAIREATGSRWSHVGILFSEGGRWFVAEGSQPTRIVSLASFIAHGKNEDYQIWRLPGLTNEDQQKLRAEASRYLGRDYDIYFEWSDDRIYCSEYTYKVFRAALGRDIGVVQKIGDLKLDGPFMQELIRRRLAETGRELNLEEPIVTPVSQIEDSDLILVEQQGAN